MEEEEYFQICGSSSRTKETYTYVYLRGQYPHRWFSIAVKYSVSDADTGQVVK